MTATTGLVVEDVALDELRPDPANPRRIGEDELDALERSLRQFGFVQPVLARREDRTVIGGHQRLDRRPAARPPDGPGHLARRHGRPGPGPRPRPEQDQRHLGRAAPGPAPRRAPGGRRGRPDAVGLRRGRGPGPAPEPRGPREAGAARELRPGRRARRGPPHAAGEAGRPVAARRAPPPVRRRDERGRRRPAARRREPDAAHDRPALRRRPRPDLAGRRLQRARPGRAAVPPDEGPPQHDALGRHPGRLVRRLRPRALARRRLRLARRRPRRRGRRRASSGSASRSSARSIWDKGLFAIGRSWYHWGHEPCWVVQAQGRPNLLHRRAATSRRSGGRPRPR